MSHAAANNGYAFTLGSLVADFGGPWRVTWSSPVPLALFAGSVALFLLLVFFVWPCIYSDRKAARESLAAPLAYIHYVLLCVFSAVVACGTAWHIVSSGELGSFTDFACTAVPPWLRIMSALFTVSKIWEWGDTGALFARGKTVAEIGFLHLYHHATTFGLFLLVMNFPSTEKAGMLLNGAVHTIMYAHYAWRLPKWARPLITLAQIVQLVYCTWLWYVTPLVCSAFASFPNSHPLEFVAPFFMVPVYTIFFLHFFWTSYIVSAASTEKSAEKEKRK
jgi:hypothetical protein